MLAEFIQLIPSNQGGQEGSSGCGVMAEGNTLSDAKEAMLFSLLGYLTLNGIPGNVHTATGASASIVLGNVTAGKNYKRTDVMACT